MALLALSRFQSHPSRTPPPPPYPMPWRRAKEAGVAAVLSLQDATDLANQKVDLAAVAGECRERGIAHMQVGGGHEVNNE